MNTKLFNTFLLVTTLFLITYILLVGKALIVPFIAALFFWYLINTIAHFYCNLHVLHFRLPWWVGLLLAIATLIGFLTEVVHIITSNIASVVSTAPVYQQNFLNLNQKIAAALPWVSMPNLSDFLKTLDINYLISQVASMFTSIASYTGIIFLYVLFLFIEQNSFTTKLHAIFPSKHHQDILKIIEKIGADIRTYLGIKTLLSVVTAVISYGILRWAEVDFASFWALLIFFLNYIPTIGSILATLFPAILTLLQFDSLYPFIIVTSSLSFIQFVLGNIVEPRMMGESLNLSPLVILITLAFWGSVWGVVGMFLSVPITVVMMIVLSHFPSTQTYAILLSSNGKI